ncbi:MAG TPA: hypothetical protein VK440_03495, partial [Burkholderiales bacterium]|nr:hypothetical protein [Burkholderiales bacterium]
MVQVTVVPAFTFSSCGPKEKFPILTAVVSAATAGVVAKRKMATTPVTRHFVIDLIVIMIAPS